jgi:hypothetical protein
MACRCTCGHPKSWHGNGRASCAKCSCEGFEPLAASAPREERIAHARRVYEHQRRLAEDFMALQADFDRGARAFFDFLRRGDVERAAQPNLTGDQR